jgi:hypothetical protein
VVDVEGLDLVVERNEAREKRQEEESGKKGEP